MRSLLYLLGALSCFYVVSGVNNGELVNIDDYPYVVAILSHSVTGSSACTGGIINERFILSAAHCFSKNKNFALFGPKREYRERIVKVYLGVENVRRVTNKWYAVAEEIYILQEYFDNLVNDIAVVKLDRSIREANRPFRVLNIPPQDSGASETRGIFVTAGYGDDPSNDKTNRVNANSLKKVITVALKLEKCRGQQGIIIEGTKQLCCASRNDINNVATMPANPLGTCQGDSGGPIVTRDGLTVQGVVSRVPPLCDGRKSPELHINVAAFADIFIYPVLNNRIIAYPSIVKYPSRSESCSA